MIKTHQPSVGSITLPRLGFEIGGLTYDPIRKMNRVQKFKKVKSSSSDSNKLDTQYMIPVPYNMDITLYDNDQKF